MDITGKMLAGRYELLEEIGKGGMAHVYKAQDHFLNRFVAVKVLKEELRDDREFVNRFNTEAQAAARISSPHVVSIYDVGFEDGLYYIVMEYVEGITLKEYISEKKSLSWKQAAEFAAQICEGLDAAHQQSVIHRDIKPQNIIMTADNILKVTDFGIARATSQATTTNSGATIGTVHYLSPEQARGGYTNERTDIYSLGVVLYEMLTGRLPFDDSTAVAIAIKHIQEKPVLPRILNNDIPKAMEDVVLKAMNKEQDLRYNSAAEFLADLRKVIKNPRVELGIDDAGMTRKRAAITDEELRKNDRKNRNTKRENSGYAERNAKGMEESGLRDLDRKRAIREQKKKERRVTIAAILSAVLVIVCLAFAFSSCTGGEEGGIETLFNGEEKVMVPNLIGMTHESARKQYGIDGFSIVVKETRNVEGMEPGIIIEQDPAAGTDMTKKGNMIIKVVVSGSAEGKDVPEYTKMKIEDAKKKIEDDGFTVNIIEEESSSVEKGVVISQMPTAGSTAEEGSLITLYVSKGDSKNNANKTEETNRPSNNNTNQNPQTNNTPTTTQQPENTDGGSQGETTTPATGGESNANGNTAGTTGGNNTPGGSTSETTGGSQPGSGSSSGSTGGQTPSNQTSSQTAPDITN